MEKLIEFGNFFLKAIELEREVDFMVYDVQGYFCRLVPGFAGFELSQLDLALGNDINLSTVAQLSDFIVRTYA